MKKIFKEFEKNKFFTALFVLVFPYITVFILGPVEIYAGNANQFLFSISDFFFAFLFFSIFTILFGALFLSILPNKIFHKFLFFIFSISFLAYLQNMFFNTKLIQADGDVMNWDELQSYTIVNLIVWIILFIILLIIFIKTKENLNWMKYCSIFISLIELVAVLSILIANPIFKNQQDSYYTFKGKEQLSLAANNNIIVLCLDHYSSDDFDKFYSSYKADAEAVMHDFTYYTNADSRYNYTFPAMDYFMTGKELDSSLTIEEWQEAIWNDADSRAFYDILHENNYSILMFSNEESNYVIGNLKYLDGLVDNVDVLEGKVHHKLLCTLLTKMSLYRYLPYALKPFFELPSDAYLKVYEMDDIDDALVYDNGDFAMKLLTEGLKVNSEFDNLYTFIHIQGMHGPYDTYCNGLSSTPNYTEDIDVEQGLNCILREYFNQLKKLGLYDSSTIIVMSDHGGGETKPQPIFFLKNANEKHDSLQFNNAPIYYEDYRATILSFSGIPYEEYKEFGTTIFEWDEGQSREREQWFPAKGDGYNVYRYSTDKDELVKLINDKEYEHVVSKTIDKWHTKDDPLFRKKLEEAGELDEE